MECNGMVGGRLIERFWCQKVVAEMLMCLISSLVSIGFPRERQWLKWTTLVDLQSLPGTCP